MKRIAPAAFAVLAAGLALSAAGCGGGGGPVDTAVVSINLPNGNVAAPTFPLEINVTGCDVKKMELYDRGTFVQNVAFAGNPMHLELNPTQVKFTRFAESLNLTANMTCTDGRTAQSLSAAGTFWPVKEVNTPVGALPKSFVAEGSGAGVAFVGCMPGAGGVRVLVKVDKFGNVLGNPVQVPGCSDAAIISDRHPLTGLRWLYDPPDGTAKWNGAMAFNPKTMTVSASYSGTGANGPAVIRALGVGPDGNAVIWDATDLQGNFLRRLPHTGGLNIIPVWSQPLPQPLNAVPVVDATQSVVVPGWQFQTGQTGLMYVERYNYAAPGTRSARNDLVQTSFTSLAVYAAPPAQLNASGTMVYFPAQQPNGTSVVYACSTTVSDCSFTTAPARKWQSGPINGVIAVAWPYARFSRIAAITPSATTFINADTGGAVASPTSGVVTAGGQLVTLAFQPGAGREFFQLNGPNLLGAEPQEIVGMESAEAGELYRYAVASGGLTAALDDAGEIWFRLGTKIVRPYPLIEYRMALQH
ncbi:MAG TPA: hypothetical protein VIG99_26885 [Myxococcaceae bacterium]